MQGLACDIECPLVEYFIESNIMVLYRGNLGHNAEEYYLERNIMVLL